MGLDDVRAIYALIAGEKLDIHGLLTVEGSSSLGRGTDNLIGLLETSGIRNIDIFMGKAASGLPSPIWRDVANNLGGLAFPPPREIKAEQDPFVKLKHLLASHYQLLHYLALGPLANLACLESKYPGTLKHLHTLWIPVRFSKEGRIKDWNLVWDKSSSEKVLKKTRRIVLIDLDSAGVVNESEFFSSIQGSSPAGEWIVKTIAKSGGKAPHLMIYDELAAAALIKPGLVKVGEKPWIMNGFEGDCIQLKRKEDGNIFVATFSGNKEALRILKECWSKTPRSHTHDPISHSPKMLIKAFHGHLGPYVVLGFRMGKLALREMGAEGHFDISAEVYSVLSPPCSCIIDGIQLGSGCTLGKRNIEVHPFDGPAYSVFSTKEGSKIIIRLKSEIPGLITSLVDENGVEPTGEIFLEKDIDSLFDAEVLKK